MKGPSSWSGGQLWWEYTCCDNGPPDSSGTPIGPIAGGVAGAVVLVIAVALVVIFVAKKKKSNDHSSIPVTTSGVQMTKSAAETGMVPVVAAAQPVVAAGQAVPSYTPEPKGEDEEEFL